MASTHSLHTAVASLDADAVAACIAAGVDVNARQATSGKAPLHIVFDKYKNTRHGRELLPAACSILHRLLAAGANPNLLDAAERTPLLLALRVHAPPDCIEALLRAGADPNAACCGRTPFVEAVDSNQYASLAHLLEAGADPMAEDALYPCIRDRRYEDDELVLTILAYTPRDSAAYRAYVRAARAQRRTI